ncbi:MocR-like pyridoxine biosynthesis transcription factor PdxR [Fulvivirga lutea]|uniref:PLP-dependent aminotransferase family protein n=1 Tax=Fulvivirga lutea TaxID=2810512 RepID=A0A975A1Z2_9BACT|nr:PLP-dependent aminotransferase family protein [Fulvivirga lutea]QSE98934.1 PLP-dependent aminotransferase family protein [Fulvivirga lutea]
MFPWKSTLAIQSSSSKPIYLQLTEQIIQEISAGRLTPGLKLPGTRHLSEILNVNRKTIQNSYDELLAQGWLVTKPSSGTYVSHSLPISSFETLDNNGLIKSSTVTLSNRFNLEFVPKYNPTKARLAFDGGSPDSRLAPWKWIFRESQSILLSRKNRSVANYSDAKGDAHFREILTKYLAESRGLNITKDNLLITEGSQMGIYLSLHGLLNPNDAVVVGNSSYDAADWTIQSCGAEIVRVSVDDDGLNIDELESICSQKKIKLVYITPHHHYPTTVTLSNERRIKLLNLSSQYGFTILEDDYDYDFHYSSNPILPLASLNPVGNVIYIGSFSKLLASNVRVGYVVAHKDLIESFSKHRRIVGRQGDHLMQHVIGEAIISGELNRHLKKSNQTYKQRRNLMASILTSDMSDYIQFKLPEGGMAIWAHFLNSDLTKLHEAINMNGLNLDIDRDLSRRFNSARIGFASVNENEIIEGMEILNKSLRQLAS